MFTGVPGTLIKEANIITSHCNLCSQLIKSLKSISFNLNFFFFSFLNKAPHNYMVK